MNILITGATGFIGSKFIKSLNSSNLNIKIVSRKKNRLKVWLHIYDI